MMAPSDSDGPPLVANVYLEEGSRLAPTDVVRLDGYLGAAEDDDHWRLYPTLELDAYIEFLASDVVGHAATTIDATEATVIWLRASAQVQFMYGALTQSLDVEMLTGDVLSKLVRFDRPPENWPSSGYAEAKCPRSGHPYP